MTTFHRKLQFLDSDTGICLLLIDSWAALDGIIKHLKHELVVDGHLSLLNIILKLF